MGTTVFPTVNDVAPDVGGGKTLKEASLTTWLKSYLGQNFVISGLTLPASSVDLTLSVAAGKAFIAGYLVEKDAAENVTCAASATNHIYLKLTKNAGGNVTGAVYEVNTTGTAPADSVKIGTATTDIDNVTSTTDARPLKPFGVGQVQDALGAGTANTSVELLKAFVHAVDTRSWVATTWNADDQPTHIDVKDGATVVTSIDITYNANGKVATLAATAGGQTVTYTVTWTGDRFDQFTKAVT